MGQVQQLPDPVNTINLRVVQEKCRVTGGNKWITAGVATHGEMAAAVDAQLAVDVSRIGLHDGLEMLNVIVFQDQTGRVEEGGEALGDAGV